MVVRGNRFWMTILASLLAWVTLIAAGVVRAANTLPIASSWNISSSGKASASGELLFRVTTEADSDPVEVTVFVLSGANETGVASSIRRAFSTQLDSRRFDVAAGEGANVLVTDTRANGKFALELIDSDVENVRVQVQSASPVAPPTVPPQNVPATPPAIPSTPAEPGSATPPPEPALATPSAPPAILSPAPVSPPPAIPSPPPAEPSAPPATPSAPPDAIDSANGGAGAPASAPPPPPGV